MSRLRIFVYGTLMRGEANDRQLAGLAYAPARTRAEWTMVSLGGFPGIIAGGATTIDGEVYEVNDRVLARLDRLEGHPHFYRRMPVLLVDGTLAETYVLPASYRNDHNKIPSGSWRRERKPEAWLAPAGRYDEEDDE